jgi:hypothetical protein
MIETMRHATGGTSEGNSLGGSRGPAAASRLASKTPGRFFSSLKIRKFAL